MLYSVLFFYSLSLLVITKLIIWFMKKTDDNKKSFYHYSSSWISPIKTNFRKTGTFVFVFVILMLFSLITQAKEKYTNVKIYVPETKDQLLDLLSMLEIDHYHEHDGAFNYTVDQEELQLLKASGYKYEVTHEDAQKYLEEENAKYWDKINNGKPDERVAFERSGDVFIDTIIRTPNAFVVQPTFGGYYTYAQMNTAIRNLKIAYPTLVDTFTIGYSTLGNAIKCLKISDNPTVDENEPEILFMGHHHAREAISGASMIFLMQYLCQNYSNASDTRIRDLINNREIFIIVCANPDGWLHNESLGAGGQWRKNRRNNGSGQFGVDLNRNWGVNWANCTGAVGAASCGSSTTSSDVYWGPSMYSEPETRALRLFCRSRDFGAVMDQHSVGPYYSLPWGRNFDVMSALDDDVYTQMSAVMGKYNGMRYGSTMQTLGYEVSGGMKDVLLRGDDSLPNGKCYGMTGEGSNGSSATNFWPLSADIIRLCKGMVYQDIQLIYTVGSYVDLQDRGSLNLNAKNANFHFSVRRIGLGNDTVRVSVLPLQNISSVGATKVILPSSLPNFNSIYMDSISYVLPAALGAGNSIRYVWRVETGGYTYYDTVTNIFQGVVLMTDNMETGSASSNWTINSGWAYTNDMAFNGTRSLAESPSADYSDNVNLIAQRTANLNLSGAGSAYLTFWSRYRAENFRDFLRVEVSTNGTTWVALSGVNTVRYPGTADGNRLADSSALTGLSEFWSRQIFDLRNFLGASALRLRLRFNSGASSVYVYDNDNGFNIDDITVITGGTPTLLPVELISFSGRNNGDVNELQWNTASELNTKQFIVERSVNGIDYEPIGKVTAAGNSNRPLSYNFTDTKPYNGENIYRLRIEDLDDSYEYSKLVFIRVQNESALTPTGIQKIYPNPTSGKMFVEFYVEEEKEVFNYNIYNTSGQILKNENMTLSKGMQIIEFDVSDFSKGQYFVTFNNLSKNISYENKFLKL